MAALAASAQVVPTQHFDPELPVAALAVSELDERCAARVMVDPRGFVYRVLVEGCAAPYADATAAALWRWVIPPTDAATSFALEVRFFVRRPEDGGTGSAQVEVGPVSASEPLTPTVPATIPISALTITKRKEPDVSAAMVYLSQEKGLVEVFCRVEVVIDAKGKVADLSVHECHPELVDSIAAAVRKWRFASAEDLSGGKRVTIVMPVRSYVESRGMGAAP
jgi:hypothetical protein